MTVVRVYDPNFRVHNPRYLLIKATSRLMSACSVTSLTGQYSPSDSFGHESTGVQAPPSAPVATSPRSTNRSACMACVRLWKVVRLGGGRVFLLSLEPKLGLRFRLELSDLQTPDVQPKPPKGRQGSGAHKRMDCTLGFLCQKRVSGSDTLVEL